MSSPTRPGLTTRLLHWMQADGDDHRLVRRMFWTGLIVRILYITLARTYHVRLAQDHFQFAWEAGRIARALATGYGFADPFSGHTGPTAWVPPLFPLLLAGIFKLFGVYTAASAWVILAIDSVFSAAIAPAIYEIAQRCFDRQRIQGFDHRRNVALWSGWLWALYPAAIQYAVHWIWEMSITTCLFTWTLVIALRLRGIGDRDNEEHHATVLWSLFGLFWGLIALSNPSVLLFLPVVGLWLLMGQQPLPSVLPRAALAAVICVACIAPWIARNAIVFHAFIPMRGNFGAELYEAANPTSQGFPIVATLSRGEFDPNYQLYKRLGEVAYVKHKGELAKAFIRADEPRFFGYALQRVYFFWVSVPHPIEKNWTIEIVREMDFCFLSLAGLMGLALALKRRVPAAGLFAWAFVLLPLLYYFVTVQARFRHPLEPLITIFAVFLFQSTQPRRRPDKAA